MSARERASERKRESEKARERAREEREVHAPQLCTPTAAPQRERETARARKRERERERELKSARTPAMHAHCFGATPLEILEAVSCVQVKYK